MVDWFDAAIAIVSAAGASAAVPLAAVPPVAVTPFAAAGGDSFDAQPLAGQAVAGAVAVFRGLGIPCPA